MTYQVFPVGRHGQNLFTLALLIGISIFTIQADIALAIEGEVWGHWPGDLGVNIEVIEVSGSISVPVGRTLEIDPGISIVFINANSRFSIFGTLLAVGDSLNQIRFYQQNSYAWLGIRFEQGSNDASTLEWCEIRNAYTGIVCHFSNPTFRHNLIIAQQDGINCIGSSPEISDNVILIGGERNLWRSNGIYLNEGSDANIQNNWIEVQSISDQAISGINFQLSAPRISGNWIDIKNGNTASVHGILSIDSNRPTIKQNIIRTRANAEMFGIKVLSSSSANLRNNTIHMIGSASRAVGIEASQSIVIVKNNIIIGSQGFSIGINSEGNSISEESGYNNIWQHRYIYHGDYEGSITDLVDNPEAGIDANPLLDSLMFAYLPKHYNLTWSNRGEDDEEKSPCIDAGDPNFRDPDSTRSDIGARYYDQSGFVGVYERNIQPESFRLVEVYPNPFNANLLVEVTLPSAKPTKVTSFSLTGRRIQDIWAGNLAQGKHHFRWTPENIPAGEYLIRVDTGDKNEIKRVIYLP